MDNYIPYEIVFRNKLYYKETFMCEIVFKIHRNGFNWIIMSSTVACTTVHGIDTCG